MYVDELTSLLAPVADDARTQVSFDPELVSSYRLVGYENRAMDDHSFADLSADAGELGAGHHASALYEVWTAPDVAPGTPIGTAQVLWKSPGTNAPGSASAPVLAADPEASMSDSLALATAVADSNDAPTTTGGSVSVRHPPSERSSVFPCPSRCPPENVLRNWAVNRGCNLFSVQRSFFNVCDFVAMLSMNLRQDFSG